MSDAKGGHWYRQKGTGQWTQTKPNGHRNEILNLKKGLKNQIDDWNDGDCGKCEGCSKRILDPVWEVIKRPIPLPPIAIPFWWGVVDALTPNWKPETYDKVGNGALVVAGSAFAGAAVIATGGAALPFLAAAKNCGFLDNLVPQGL